MGTRSSKRKPNWKKKYGVHSVGTFRLREVRALEQRKKRGAKTTDKSNIKLKEIENPDDIPYILVLKPHRFYIIDVINQYNDEGLFEPLAFWSWFYDPISARVAIRRRLKSDYTRYWVVPGYMLIENDVKFFKADQQEAGMMLHHYGIEYPPEFMTARQRATFRRRRRKWIRQGKNIYDIWYY